MLEVKDLTIHFGGLAAVEGVNMHIRKGMICSLIGPNGAGKTTCFNLLSGVYKPTRGEVTFQNENITGLLPYQIHEKGISRTYQQIRLFGTMTVLDNVLVGMHDRMRHGGMLASVLNTAKKREEERAAREKAHTLLQFVDLDDKWDAVAKNLSYGEQRLLEIARALAGEPSLLLLDEPAAGMNTKEKADLMEIILKIKEKGYTVLIVEHDMKLIMGIADYIYVLNYGKLIAEGTAAEVQSNPEVIAAYLGE